MAEIIDFKSKQPKIPTMYTYRFVLRRFNPTTGVEFHEHIVKGVAIGLTPTFVAVSGGEEIGANFVCRLEDLETCVRVDDNIEYSHTDLKSGNPETQSNSSFVIAEANSSDPSTDAA